MTGGVSADRRRAMLRTAMGPAIAEALADPRVIEIMVNPDGALRLDRLGEGRTDTEVRMDTAPVERIIRLVASHARAEVHGDAPIRSEERRVGKECVSTCRSRWFPYPSKKKPKKHIS